MLPNFVTQVRQEVLDERDAVAAALAGNAAKTLDDYRYMTGIIRGLDVSVDLLERRMRAFMEVDR
jgi:hypothetical protein